MNVEQFIKVLDRAYTYSPDGSDFDIIIDGYDKDDAILWGHDDDGNEYEIPFEDVNFEKDTFFELTEIAIDTVA